MWDGPEGSTPEATPLVLEFYSAALVIDTSCITDCNKRRLQVFMLNSARQPLIGSTHTIHHRHEEPMPLRPAPELALSHPALHSKLCRAAADEGSS